VTSPVLVRPAIEGDLAAIVEIYNHYVATSHCTFDIDPYTVETRRPWFNQFAATGRHRLLVATIDGAVVGYAGTMGYRPKRAYETTVECTCYVSAGHLGRGAGASMYRALFRDLAGEDIHRILAGIAIPHAFSVTFHEHLGFRQVAHYTEQGRKFGRYWDTVWLERPFP
jgi:phosphinothricin acetyltransferase